MTARIVMRQHLDIAQSVVYHSVSVAAGTEAELRSNTLATRTRENEAHSGTSVINDEAIQDEDNTDHR